MTTIKQFEVGKTYETRSICDHDTVYRFEILARTAKTITTKVHGKTVKRGLSVYEDAEQFKPHGSYSMCAIISANKETVTTTTAVATVETLTMVICERRYPVASLAEASAMFVEARDKSGLGGSQTPTPMIYDAEGKLVAHVSYNGRVWAGDPRDWKPGTKPLMESAR